MQIWKQAWILSVIIYRQEQILTIPKKVSEIESEVSTQIQAVQHLAEANTIFIKINNNSISKICKIHSLHQVLEIRSKWIKSWKIQFPKDKIWRKTKTNSRCTSQIIYQWQHSKVEGKAKHQWIMLAIINSLIISSKWIFKELQCKWI